MQVKTSGPKILLAVLIAAVLNTAAYAQCSTPVSEVTKLMGETGHKPGTAEYADSMLALAQRIKGSKAWTQAVRDNMAEYVNKNIWGFDRKPPIELNPYLEVHKGGGMWPKGRAKGPEGAVIRAEIQAIIDGIRGPGTKLNGPDLARALVARASRLEATLPSKGYVTAAQRDTSWLAQALRAASSCNISCAY